MPSLFRILEQAVIKLELCAQALGDNFPQPSLIDYGGLPFFRHKGNEYDDLLASYLKCIRMVSSLKASLVLLKKGFVQEVYVLCRCIDEFFEDILFLSTPLNEGSPSKDQRRFIEEFYQEEFDHPKNPLASTQKRDRVPRKVY